MTIVVPDTFDELVELTKRIQMRLRSFDENNDIEQMAWRANIRLEAGINFIDAYLQEETDTKDFNGGQPVIAETLKTHIEYLLSKPTESFDALTPLLAKGKTGLDLRDSVISLTQAALDIRAPLGENKLARFALDQTVEAATVTLASVWDESHNPAGALVATCHQVLDGGEVPFVSLRAGVRAVNDFTTRVCGYSHSPTHETVIAQQFGMITGFACEIMKQAEARLPQSPVPAAPARQPIFTKGAAPSV